MRQDDQNKYFSILGDSISTLAGSNPPDCAVFYEGSACFVADVFAPADTWWGQVIEALGGQLLVNHSVSGSTVTKQPIYELPNYGCSEERAEALSRDGISPDVIMIFMGVNDCGYRVRLAPTAPEEERDLAIFSVAYRRLLENLRRLYPNAELWCLTFPRYSGVRAAWEGSAVEKFIFAIADAAREMDCRVIDLFSAPDVCETIDGLHPNVTGMQTIASAVLDAVK